MTRPAFRRSVAIFASALSLVSSWYRSQTAHAAGFAVKNLITDDGSINPATLTDAHLQNAWGISATATSPFWVSDNATGLSTLYRVDATTDVPTKVALEVTIPGAGSVTGQVNNPAGAGAFNGDNFLFVSEDGAISGWRSALGTTAEVLKLADSNNVYKGTTAATVGGHGYLYSANFHAGTVDILKGDAGAPDIAGHFTDPTLPSGYAPFNIQNLAGTIYVTYALQAAGGTDDAPGAGHGFVDQFDLNGNFVARIGTQGTLNSPWGLALAPSSFGTVAGDLLVGNFGDGTINIFNPTTHSFVGQLSDSGGQPLAIDGLWGLYVGNSATAGMAGSSSKVYFSAGPNDEAHGLFGVIQAVPEPASLFFLAAGSTLLLRAGRRRRA